MLASPNNSLCKFLEPDDVAKNCAFWVQGVLLAIVGAAGVIGNGVSHDRHRTVVLTRPAPRLSHVSSLRRADVVSDVTSC